MSCSGRLTLKSLGRVTSEHYSPVIESGSSGALSAPYWAVNHFSPTERHTITISGPHLKQ